MEYNDTILTFDTLYTTNEIQLLKLALPLLSNQLQPIAATLIKMRELEYCLSRLPHTKIHDFSIAVDRLDTFFYSAMPFCNQQQKKLFSQLQINFPADAKDILTVGSINEQGTNAAFR